jgi:hypothetical protein
LPLDPVPKLAVIKHATAGRLGLLALHLFLDEAGFSGPRVVGGGLFDEHASDHRMFSRGA